MKRINFNYIIILLILLIVIFVIFKCSIEQKKKANGLQIEKTDNVITQIKAINEFVTANYYEELALHFSKKSTKLLDRSRDEIVMIAKGQVRAGFNMSKIKENDIEIHSDTIMLILPQAEILDVIINPSDFEIYVEDGKWSKNQIDQIKLIAKKRIREHAIQEGILPKATIIAQRKLKEILQASGFNVITIQIGLNKI